MLRGNSGWVERSETHPRAHKRDVIAAHHDQVAAFVVRAIDQQPAHAHVGMSTKAIFCGRLGMPHHSADWAERKAARGWCVHRPAHCRVGSGADPDNQRRQRKGDTEGIADCQNKR